MNVRAVFLDFGGTLAQPTPKFKRPASVWTETFPKYNVSLAEAEVEEAIEHVDLELGGRIYSYVGRTDEFWHLYDRALMDRLGIRERRDEIETAVQEIFDDPSSVQLYPETRDLLTELKAQGYRMGLLSNHHDGLMKVLKYHRIDPFFESVTYSQEVGAEKPAPAMFQRALERAGCAASDVVHVGDSLSADVEGARRSGLVPIWINRKGLPGSPELLTIQTLSELPPLLKQLSRASSP
ncbi:MAG: HAD family hydrolase [Thermoplasmata archaeon]